MSDEQFEDFVRKTATSYRVPPITPTEEIWQRIQAERQAKASDRGPVTVVDLASRRPSPRWIGGLLAAAALLALGIGLGRYSLRQISQPNLVDPAVARITPADTDSARASSVMRYAAVNTLSQVETLFTDYQADRIDDRFRTDARDLLSETRMLLGSPRLTDPRLKKLLEDLEVMLVQVARLNRTGQGEERGYIDDGMAQRAIRQRLRSAIPAGPTA